MQTNTGEDMLRFFVILAFIVVSLVSPGWSLDAPGNIFYQKDGNIFMVQPDGAGERQVVRGSADGGMIAVPGTSKLIYCRSGSIYMQDVNATDGNQLLYSGKTGEELNVYFWRICNNTLIFRRKNGDGSFTYFQLNPEDKSVKELDTFHEMPEISDDGRFWAYTTYVPGKGEKSQIYVSEIGGEDRLYVFQGRERDIICWDKENPVVIYTMNDKIYAYDVENRLRQIINLPSHFKEVSVVAYNSLGLVMFFKENVQDMSEDKAGIILFDPSAGEQKAIVEGKKSAALVCYNNDLSKMVVFIPTKFNDFMGDGDLYLLETEKGESVKLTRDVGRRVLRNKSLIYQWSPDGKHFIYEKLRLKRDVIRKSEIWITGEGINECLRKKAGEPIWAVIK